MSLKEIKGFPGYYINRNGEVWSMKQERPLLLKQNIDRKGYLRVGLYKGAAIKLKFIHQLIAIAFIPNPEDKPHINHIDCNTLNNSVDNLEWCTNAENVAHSLKEGRYRKNEGHQNAKLTDKDVEHIKYHRTQGAKLKDLAKSYGVSVANISLICNGKRRNK